MADNVNITEGTGTVIATDQVGTTHFQKVKLVDGTAESTTVIAAGGGVEAGALRVTIASDSTGVISIDDNGSTISVDGTVTANLGATDNAVLDAIQAAVEVLDNIVSGSEAQVDVVTVPAPLNVVGGGTEAAALRVTLANNSTGVVSVDDNGGTLTVDGTVAATQSGTWNVGTVTAVTGITNVVQVGDNSTTLSVDDGGGALTVDGTVAATQSGTWNIGTVTAVTAISNALPAGTNAIGKLAANSGVDIGDVDVLSIAAGTNNIGDVDIVTMPVGGYCPSTDITSACSTDITTATATEILAAPGSGKYYHITSILVTNGDADTGTFVNLYPTTDGTGTVKWTGYAASAGGGYAMSFPVPLAFGDNEPIYAKCESSDATVRVSIAGYIK